MIKKILILALAFLVFSSTVVAQDDIKEPMASYDAQQYCIEIGEMYSVSPYLLMAMIETESGGQQYAENRGCYGLMQVSTKWNADRIKRLGITNIFDEYSNILAGCDLLAELCEKYEDVSYALDVYNGNSKAKYYANNGILSNYSSTILNRAYDLEELFGIHNEAEYLREKRQEKVDRCRSKSRVIDCRNLGGE